MIPLRGLPAHPSRARTVPVEDPHLAFYKSSAHMLPSPPSKGIFPPSDGREGPVGSFPFVPPNELTRRLTEGHHRCVVLRVLRVLRFVLACKRASGPRKGC